MAILVLSTNVVFSQHFTEPADVRLPENYPFDRSVIERIFLVEGASFPNQSAMDQARTIVYAASCRRGFDMLMVVQEERVEVLTEILEILRRQRRENTDEYATALRDLQDTESRVEGIQEAERVWARLIRLSSGHLQLEYSDILNEVAAGRINNGVQQQWLAQFPTSQRCTPAQGLESANTYTEESLRRNFIVVRYGSDVSELIGWSDWLEADLQWLRQRGVQVEAESGLDNPECVAVILNGVERYRYSALAVDQNSAVALSAMRLAEGLDVPSRRGASDC
ncbi:hypothetical protein V8J82_23215 [Gymnodinialimonas sp. 2305UL16-5]|uniref:hypothetical protein n=1 Tax=Gymnodinialimonas mytili TaxID=3126503 RepID=UPI00309524EB